MTDPREKTERVWLQFGNDQDGVPLLIRKWSHEPFDGGAEYVRADAAHERNLLANARADNAVADPEKARAMALEEAAKLAEDDDGNFWWSGTSSNAAIGQRVCLEIAAAIRALAAGKEG